MELNLSLISNSADFQKAQISPTQSGRSFLHMTVDQTIPLYLLIWLPPALMTGLMVGTDCCTNWPYYLWLVWCGFAWPVAAFFSYFQYKRRTRMVRTLLQIAHVYLKLRP